MNNVAEKVDILFFSAFDHNEGYDSHGLFEMFKFFKNNLTKTSIFINTMNSLYSNNVDVFNISHLGEQTNLFNQITESSYRNNHPHSWKNRLKEKYTSAVSQLLIKVLPMHKFFVITDREDVDFEILENVLKHFNSKLLIISAVNNTWTGYCSYPIEFKCDLYKTKSGCDSSCPALNGNPNSQNVKKTFDSTRKFIERNQSSVLLNVGNMFSFQEAESSYLFKNVKKVLIPLKNLECEEDFQKLFDFKIKNRKDIISKHKINDKMTLVMWSSYYINIHRKGFNYLISSLTKLKKDEPSVFEKICLILSCKPIGEEYKNTLDTLGIKYILTGFLERDAYNKYASGSDFYCCTTVSDAGPRTTYESAAMATPIISFDNCNALDFVNSSNGALVETYDVDQLLNSISKLSKINNDDYVKMSSNILKSYLSIMDTDKLVNKWETFFNEN